MDPAITELRRAEAFTFQLRFGWLWVVHEDTRSATRLTYGPVAFGWRPTERSAERTAQRRKIARITTQSCLPGIVYTDEDPADDLYSEGAS